MTAKKESVSVIGSTAPDLWKQPPPLLVVEVLVDVLVTVLTEVTVEAEVEVDVDGSVKLVGLTLMPNSEPSVASPGTEMAIMPVVES